MIKQEVGEAARRVVPRVVYSRLCQLYDAAARASRFVSCLGTGRECPLCNARVRRFLPDPGEPSRVFQELHVVGGGPFEQSKCPFCGSFERERHVFLYLLLMTDAFRRPFKMLHVAPERRLARRLATQKNINYLSGDLYPGRAQLTVDLTAIDCPDETFDVIICNHVLEHVPRDHQAIGEIFRVLRPAGWAMLQVPLVQGMATREDLSVTDPDSLLRLFGQRDHVRLYGAEDYASRLERAGFVVATDSLPRRYGAAFANRYGLLPDEVLYLARKPDPGQRSGFERTSHSEAPTP